MRINKTVACGQLVNEITMSKPIITNVENTKLNNNNKMPTKEQLWLSFQHHFKLLYGKKLVVDSEFTNNIKTLFFYFLKDKEFFSCENLSSDIINPSFDKGLLVIGGVGVGKTDFFKVFESMFYNYSPLRFRGFSSNHLVTEYEICSTPKDKEYFHKCYERKRLFIDDINSEPNASNYGIYDVVGNLLLNRYDKKLITFATTNFLTPDNSVNHTLEALGERYGFRVYDRLFEMFNIIEFKGKSRR